LDRGSGKLVEAVSAKTVNYLNKFHALSSANDMAAWHKFCSKHPNEKLRSKAASVLDTQETY